MDDSEANDEENDEAKEATNSKSAAQNSGTSRTRRLAKGKGSTVEKPLESAAAVPGMPDRNTVMHSPDYHWNESDKTNSIAEGK